MKEHAMMFVLALVIGLAGWGIGMRQGQMDAYAEMMKWKTQSVTNSSK